MATERRWFIYESGVIIMSDENSEDIKRVLAICFRSGEILSSDDLERILSFDMGWMDTETAHEAIQALTFAGWLVEEGEGLTANCDVKGIQAPLGWQPRASRLTHPVVNEDKITVKSEIIEKVTVEARPVIVEKEESADPRTKVERRLTKFVIKQSGLDAEEINRRVERKIRSFRYCTTWLALCLISREQGLDMSPIIDSLSASA